MKRSLKILCVVLCLCVALLPVTAFAYDNPVGGASGRVPFGVAASEPASESASASASSSAAAADTAADPNPETGSSNVIGLVGSLAIVALLGSAIAFRKK